MSIAEILFADNPDLDQTKIQQFKDGFIQLKEHMESEWN